ncbi:MAG: glutamine--fructose-6-phosphate transaminase (isomerizing) [Bdellovibrionales bacterium]
MCGIVGYFGPQQPKDVIVKGLKALEYRGYDSAGVSILDQGHFKRVRAEGKLGNLETKLVNETFDGRLGIGHTRWATHGRPSERNAHPHCVGGVSIVHNGIIENYAELKEELIRTGSIFESETDSELVAHLLHQHLAKNKDLFTAVLEVLPRLHGAYSILSVWEQQPDVMVAFKNGPPLVVGVGEKEMLVASDIQAIMPHTRNVIFLEDNEVVRVQGASYAVFDPQGRPLSKKPTKLEWSPEQVQKGGYRHFMLKEIFEQPRAVAAALAPHVLVDEAQVRLSQVGFDGVSPQELAKLDVAADWAKTLKVFGEVEKVFIIACGTSFYAGMVGKYLIEKFARISCETDIASEFRYRHPVVPKNSLTIVISQSGETADTLAAVRLVKEQGGRVLSVCNVRNSSIDREASGHLYMNAGPEIGVASTKAFTATLSLMSLLSLALAKAKNKLDGKQEQTLVRSLLSAPSHMETVLNHDKFFSEAAGILKKVKGFLYMGRGAHYPIALEGALKLKELAYMHAEGYAAGEMKHGPLALIDEKMVIVMLAPSDDLYDKTVSNLEEAKARGGKIVSLGTGDNKKLKALSDYYLALPEVDGFIAPLLEVIPVQLLAYHVADSLGHDVDQPRNLAKSVTVE